MPLPNALNMTPCKPGLPVDTGSGTGSASAPKTPDRVEIAGVEYACRVTRSIASTRKDEMGTEYGRTAHTVRFPSRPAGVSLNTQLFWTVDDGEAMDPVYVLIALNGVLRPDENDSFYAVPCEWMGAEVAAVVPEPAEGDAGPAGPIPTPDAPIVPAPPAPEPTVEPTPFTVPADTYVLVDGSTVAYSADRSIPLPADGVSYVWLDARGNVQVT